MVTCNAPKLALPKALFGPYALGFAAFIVVMCVVVFADAQNRKILLLEQREAVRAEANQLRTALETQINKSILLVQGVVALLSAEPNISQERYDAIVGRAIEGHPEFLNIALAPDLVVTKVFPYAPNAAVIGLDYNANPVQRAAALMVRDSGIFCYR